MAAASADKPVLLEVVGPMMTGRWRGEQLGACTDCRRFWGEHRGGNLDAKEIADVRQNLVRTAGTCTVMGTASTMASVTETLGMMLPGGATPSAVSGERLKHATATGRRGVALAKQKGPLPRDVMTPEAFRNAIRVLAALGGSTNAIIHILAIARRAGVNLTLNDFDTVAADVPRLADLKPSGAGYMEDFHNSGGIPALLKVLEPFLETNTSTVAVQTLSDQLGDTNKREDWQKYIAPLEHPFGPPGALSVLRGSLAPEGAVIKVSAASPHLLNHVGPAFVIDRLEDSGLLNDPNIDITPEHVLVLRNAGPVAAGMPEAGSLPIPRKLAEQGVRDMVRVSDARMSGTSYGTVVLHCTPEAAKGGPLALVRNGDMISLNVDNRTIDLLVDEEELQERRKSWKEPVLPERGWKRLYAETVLPASEGSDLSFL